MNARLAIAAALFLSLTPRTFAHRLDEFLQATTIAVERDHLRVQIGLTPGEAVARTVLADVDTDGDGIVSAAEQRAYAERLRLELAVTLDGQRLPLRLVSARFPAIEELTEGTGIILLTFDADVPGGGPDRRLVFENHYQSRIAAYLVNCLFPDDPAIRITAQSRNYEQSFYQVDYTQAGVRPVPPRSVSEPTVPGTENRPGSLAWARTMIVMVLIAALSAVAVSGLSRRWSWRR